MSIFTDSLHASLLPRKVIEALENNMFFECCYDIVVEEFELENYEITEHKFIKLEKEELEDEVNERLQDLCLEVCDEHFRVLTERNKEMDFGENNAEVKNAIEEYIESLG